jgi:hypothetical protein
LVIVGGSPALAAWVFTFRVDGMPPFTLTCVNGDRADVRTVRFQLFFVSRGAAREGRIGYAGAVPDAFCGRRFLFSACRLN